MQRAPLEILNAPDFPLEPACEGGRCFWWVVAENREPTAEELIKLRLMDGPELEHAGHGSYDWVCWDENGEPYRYFDRKWERT